MTEVFKNFIHFDDFPLRGHPISPGLAGHFFSSLVSLASFFLLSFGSLPSHTFPELCLPFLVSPPAVFYSCVSLLVFRKDLEGLELFSPRVPVLWQLTHVLKKQLFLRDAGVSTYPGSVTLDTLIILCCFPPPWSYIHLRDYVIT